MKIALTGGIACGKSWVARCLNELGVETRDADDIVHELIPADERRKLAAKVFADPVARKELESRIHPIVKDRINKFFAPSSSAPRSAIRVAVVPLLFETHWDAEYDIILCVTSSRATQVARMMTTRGYSRGEAESRLAAQLPVEAKAEKSHYVIENEGSIGDLRAKVVAMVEWLEKEVES